MNQTSPDGLTLREARRRYFDDNGFGETGGYDDAWVDFKLGPVPFPFPNTKERVRAVKVHDLHHVLTGYRTNFLGELEIAAWELGAGCKSFAAAWVLNLGGVGAGLFRAPRRTFRAFVRGRRQESLYGEADVERLLETSVGEMRARFAPEAVDLRPRASDVLLFALVTLVGLVVGLLTFALVLPLVPLGLLAHHLRRRAAITPRSS